MKISGKVENNVDTIAVNCYNMLKETYSKEYSEIMAMFYGVYISEIVSLDGKIQHLVKPESYFILDLPVLNGMVMMNTLYECLDLFTTPEVLQGENAWFNEKTSTKENVQKRISFWNFPQVLVIMLKRITPDGQRKVHSLIQFPLDHLDLSKYVRGYNASSHVYELYGVCNHMGGVLGGHYTAYVKNAENVWIHYNDTIVEKVSNPETTIVTPKAYCLFYRKKNNLL
jgi:ubiquitin C-terminal hydrolase